MAHYRCYFLGVHGKILRAEDIEAEAASEAIAISRKRCGEQAFASFEVWQQQRRLTRETIRARRPSPVSVHSPE